MVAIFLDLGVMLVAGLIAIPLIEQQAALAARGGGQTVRTASAVQAVATLGGSGVDRPGPLGWLRRYQPQPL